MVAIRRAFLLIFTIVLSLIFSDFVVAKVIGYPAYGVSYKVKYRKGADTWTNIRKPHAQIFNVEGRIRTNYNNFGIPGIDVEKIENPVVVLGSSFVEALQHRPEKIATSIFQKRLDNAGFRASVINLGCSGHDPYDSWFRLKYYEKLLKFSSQDVILVINSDNKDWFDRHPKPFDFTLADDFGQINKRTTTRALIALRNASSYAEICANALKKKNEVNPSNDESIEKDQIHNTGLELSEEMKECLLQFNQSYTNFRVVSVFDDQGFNSSLIEFCNSSNIDCTVKPIAKPEYMINGAGHLNEMGNQLLGEVLTDIYTSSHKN